MRVQATKLTFSPSDLNDFLECEHLADELSPTALVLEAHRLEDEPDDPVEDPAAIRSLLGL